MMVLGIQKRLLSALPSCVAIILAVRRFSLRLHTTITPTIPRRGRRVPPR
jgi:hypothetical protein